MGRVEYTSLDGVLLDLDHTVEVRNKNHYQCRTHDGLYYGTTITFDSMEENDDEIILGDLEN